MCKTPSYKHQIPKKNHDLNLNLAADCQAYTKPVFRIALKDKEVDIAILKVKPFTNRFTG